MKRLIKLLFVICFLSSCITSSTGPTKIPGETQTTKVSKPYVIDGRRYYPIASSRGFVQTGNASWYGDKFHGRLTANGETYDMYKTTAAHKTLPFNTYLEVHNLENGKTTIVRINDRGPFVQGRIIDLSYTSAKALGIVGPGTAKVRITALQQGSSSHEVTAPDLTKGNFVIQVGSYSENL